MRRYQGAHLSPTRPKAHDNFTTVLLLSNLQIQHSPNLTAATVKPANMSDNHRRLNRFRQVSSSSSFRHNTSNHGQRHSRPESRCQAPRGEQDASGDRSQDNSGRGGDHLASVTRPILVPLLLESRSRLPPTARFECK